MTHAHTEMQAPSTNTHGSFAYSYAGRLLCSDIPLRGLEPFAGIVPASLPPGSVTLRIRTDKLPGERAPVFSWPGRYKLALWAKPSGWIFSVVTGAEFHIDPRGRLVECIPGAGGWSFIDAEAFARRVLPRIVQLHGGTVVHGAAVDCGGGAVLFCGSSHAGKSTLSASLQHYFGWRSLSDDMALLGTEAAKVFVYPTELGLCLWQDSFEELEANTSDEWRMMSVYGAKFRHEPLTVQARTPQPVRAVYFLDDPAGQEQRSADITSNRVPAKTALATLSCFLVRFRPNGHIADGRHFSLLAHVARTVPIRLLQYPRHYNCLRQVANQVRADLNAGQKGARSVASAS